MRSLVFVLTAWLLAGLASAEEQLVVDMAQAPEFRSPIAVALFQDLSSVKGAISPASIEEILVKDLQLSGFFEVLDRKAFLVDLEKEGFTPDQIKFPPWQALGALYLCKGWFKLEGDTVTVGAYLYDVIGRKTLDRKQYQGKPKQLRQIVHRLADRIIELITGQKGICETRIALTVKRPGKNKGIYIMDYDGAGLEPVAQDRSIHLSPDWSDDGKRLAYVKLAGLRWELWIAELGGGKPQFRKLPNLPSTISSPAFSPNGTDLALSMATRDDMEIFLVDLTGTALPRRLTSAWNIDVSPCYSPDGRQIVYTSSVTGQRHLYIMNADGTFPRRLTFNGRNNETPAWSPRGDLIVFAGMDDDGKFDLFTVKLDGSELKRLTWDTENNESPTWSPDGRYLMFASNRKIELEGTTVAGRYHLFMMKANGTNQTLITKESAGDYTEPAWGPLPR